MYVQCAPKRHVSSPRSSHAGASRIQRAPPTGVAFCVASYSPPHLRHGLCTTGLGVAGPWTLWLQTRSAAMPSDGVVSTTKDDDGGCTTTYHLCFIQWRDAQCHRHRAHCWVRQIPANHREHTLPIYEALCRRTAVPPARRAVRQTLYHPLSNDVLDDALVLYFPPSRSFTGDAVLELQLHGSPAVVRDVLSALNDLAHARSWPDLRPAEPGEFTRRAFEHGRMDLTACEALDALLRAETSEQRRLAQRAGHGRQAQMYHTLRSRLLDCMAQLEALLDFADEDDIDMQLWDDVHRHVREIRTYLAHELQLDMPSPCRSYAEAVMQGVRIALYGRTNVGKSSLLNLSLIHI